MDEHADNPGSVATCETLIDPSGTTTLRLIGELDIGSVAPIRAAVEAIATKNPERVVIDMGELRFIDSSGLSLLLAMANQVGEVELHNPTTIVRKVIELTGLSPLFDITP